MKPTIRGGGTTSGSVNAKLNSLISTLSTVNSNVSTININTNSIIANQDVAWEGIANIQSKVNNFKGYKAKQHFAWHVINANWENRFELNNVLNSILGVTGEHQGGYLSGVFGVYNFVLSNAGDISNNPLGLWKYKDLDTQQIIFNFKGKITNGSKSTDIVYIEKNRRTDMFAINLYTPMSVERNSTFSIEGMTTMYIYE